jgi:peptide/nickel transport system permease protein
MSGAAARALARLRERFASRRLRLFARSPAGLAGAAVVLALLAAAIAGPAVAPHDPNKSYGEHALTPESAEFPCGTDAVGKDVWSRVLHGARVSVVIALGAVGLAVLVGVPLGGAAGYAGGRLDALLMRVTDAFLALPSIVIALTIAALLGRGLHNVIVAVAVAEWPRFARQMRAAVLELKGREFVLASQALGAGPLRILFGRILPNAAAPLLVIGTLGLGTAVLEAAGLGFLGLGAEPGTPEWGTMLADNINYLRGYPWIALYPGLAIALTVLGFNLLGDGLREALDPRL